LERNVIWFDEMKRAYQKLVETILPLVVATPGASEVMAYLETIQSDEDEDFITS